MSNLDKHFSNICCRSDNSSGDRVYFRVIRGRESEGLTVSMFVSDGMGYLSLSNSSAVELRDWLSTVIKEGL